MLALFVKGRTPRTALVWVAAVAAQGQIYSAAGTKLCSILLPCCSINLNFPSSCPRRDCGPWCPLPGQAALDLGCEDEIQLMPAEFHGHFQQTLPTAGTAQSLRLPLGWLVLPRGNAVLEAL